MRDSKRSAGRTLFIARLVVALATSGLLAPMMLRAQDTTDSSSRIDCAGQAAALDRRSDVVAYRQAIVQVQSCPSAVAAVVAAWRQMPTDSINLELLGSISGYFRDQRVLDAATSVALDSQRRRAERLAAFRTLVRYCRWDNVLYYHNLDTPNLHGAQYVMFGTETRERPTMTPGDVPLAVSACQSVRETFEAIGASDGDPVVKAIAGRLATRLQRTT